MKKHSLFFTVLFVLAACGHPSAPEKTGTTPAAVKPQGVDVGNGGDGYAIEFVGIGEELVELLNQFPLAQVRTENLLEAIRRTKVISLETLERLGNPIDALNYPNASPPRIEINREAWDKLKLQRYKKLFLVLHEYLGIMQIDDSNYHISQRIDRGNVCTRTPAIREAIERELKMPCTRITLNDLFFIESLNASEKQITDLVPHDLAYLFSLKFLNLKHNQISKIPKGYFGDVPLEELQLDDNRIHQIDENVFRTLTQLTLLSLSKNQIRELHKDTFAGLRNLTQLNLSSNAIRNLPVGIFRDLKFSRLISGKRDSWLNSGQDLNLSLNPIEFIDKNFLGKRLLSTIDLCSPAFAPKLTIHPEAFSELPAQWERRICMNNYTNLENNTFHTLIQATDVYLLNATTLSDDQIHQLNSSEKIENLLLEVGEGAPSASKSVERFLPSLSNFMCTENIDAGLTCKRKSR